MSKLKEVLKNTIIDGEDINIYDLDVVNWPTTPNEDGGDEKLDLENWGILSITDTKMVMCAGGDWQIPVTFDIELINGKLTASNYKMDNFEIGLSHEDILTILK